MKSSVISKLSILLAASLLAIGCLAACGSQPQNIITSVQKAEAVAENGAAKLTLTLPAKDFADVKVGIENFPACIIDGTSYLAVSGNSSEAGILIVYDITTLPTASSTVSFGNDKMVVYSSVDTKSILDALVGTQVGGISIPSTHRSSSSGGLADVSPSSSSTTSMSSSSAASDTTSDSSSAASSPLEDTTSLSSGSATAESSNEVEVSDNVQGAVVRKCQSMFDVFYNFTPSIELTTITSAGEGSYHAVGRYSSDSNNGGIEITFNDDAQLSSLKVDGKELLD